MFYPELPGAHYWLWALSTPVVLWFGRNFFIRAFKQVRRFSADMDSLVALSTGVAYVFSVIQTFFPRLLSETALSGMVFYEAASMVIAIVLLGRYLEERPKTRCFAITFDACSITSITQGRRCQPRNPRQ
jgi:Cu2+-exporting ATPase